MLEGLDLKSNPALRAMMEKRTSEDPEFRDNLGTHGYNNVHYVRADCLYQFVLLLG